MGTGFMSPFDEALARALTDHRKSLDSTHVVFVLMRKMQQEKCAYDIRRVAQATETTTSTNRTKVTILVELK